MQSRMIRGGHGICESKPRADTEAWQLRTEMIAQGRRQLSKDDIARTFHLPIERAARSLGVGLTVLKRQCREFGISRWPFRKMKSLERMLSIVEATSICNTKLLPMSGLQSSEGCVRSEAGLTGSAVASPAHSEDEDTIAAYSTCANMLEARRYTSHHITSRGCVPRSGGKARMTGTARLDRLAALAAALLSSDGTTRRPFSTQNTDGSRLDGLVEHSQWLTDAKLRALPRAVISSDDLLMKLDKVAYEYGYEIVRSAAQQDQQKSVWELP